MSGGGANRKKPQRGQCWEEAASEFYQESYPTTDVEVEVLQKDPKHLATLLPSKQNRAATIRIRNNDSKTIRRQTSSRSRRESTTIRRPSMAADVEASMLPDFSQNLSNEQKTWEEIMEIKAMPVPMAQKKQLKDKIQKEPNLRLQGYEQFKWRRRKVAKQARERFEELLTKLELWRGDLKRIEGTFGTGVVAYFLFIRWLVKLNLAMSLLIVLFVILPSELTNREPLDANVDDFNNSTTTCCACTYFNQSTELRIEDGLDLIQGTGFFERTLLFYGNYPSGFLEFFSGWYYNLPLAFVVVTVAIFLLCLAKIVRAAARDFKDRLVEGEGQFYQYCHVVFGGWDFCIHDEKAAGIKHKALYNELKACLEIERLEEDRQGRTRNERIKLLLIRLVVNVMVVVVLAGGAAAVYFAFTESWAALHRDGAEFNAPMHALYEFLPSVTIVVLNIAVPFVFRFLVGFERYSALFVVRITLLRTIILRLFSLIVLYYTLYQTVTCEAPANNSSDTCRCSDQPVCWETYVGQQYYKLLLTDFGTQTVLTFFVNFPRAFVARTVGNKCAKLLGEQSFDLPKHVLDVVYAQTLCWIGLFYSPLLPAIATITSFLTFYVKKFACLVNSVPSQTVYRASRSKSMFMLVLLISYAFAALPLAYVIGQLQPSRSCGPFRDLPTAWSVVELAFFSTPAWVRSIAYFVATPGFALPVIAVLGLTLYYYTAVIDANRHMVSVLKNQLVLEGHDKQFLLDRLSSFMRHQQDLQKRLRHAEIMREGERNVSSN